MNLDLSKFSFEFFYLLLFFFLGILSLTVLRGALQKTGKFQVKQLLQKKIRFLQFFKNFFLGNEWESLYFLIYFTKNLLLVFYTITSFFFLRSLPLQEETTLIVLFFVIPLGALFFFDFFIRALVVGWPKQFFKIFFPFALFYLLLFFPVTGFAFRFLQKIEKKRLLGSSQEKIKVLKDRMMEFFRDTDLHQFLDSYDQKIIASLITFREKVAREVMIPRVNLFSLPAETTLREAAQLFLKQDYSRIPIYQGTLDNIIGVLMYKDVLKAYASEEKKDLLSQRVEKIVKPVLYAPENKKISHLFQEFRSKKTHMAIIVNEYGGTEGIVTIEDILEELVGEIEDEYDIEKQNQYKKLSNGSWIVDAKMTIIDIESKLDVKIPHHPEYETIGGYIFHKAGTIPSSGWKLHQDQFEIEVIQSNERCIEKIRMTPISLPPSE